MIDGGGVGGCDGSNDDIYNNNNNNKLNNTSNNIHQQQPQSQRRVNRHGVMQDDFYNVGTVRPFRTAVPRHSLSFIFRSKLWFSFQTLSDKKKSQQGATAFALWTGSACTGHQRMHLRLLQTKFNHAA